MNEFFKKESTGMAVAFSVLLLLTVSVQPLYAQDVAHDERDQGHETENRTEKDEDQADADVREASERLVVTGSRIRRIDLETSTPVSTISAERIQTRGYTNAADALLDSPLSSGSSTPRNVDYNGSAIGSGQYFISLANLGSQRTLTLVNGRRMVSSNSSGNGSGGNQVDASIIPVGLIDRIEIVQVGGAAVYGTDAIAGVVNYILKDDFEGLELDGQYSDSSAGDYGVTSLRGTFGKNFLEQRANLAVNLEYSDSPYLMATEREATARGYATAANPDYDGPGSGETARLPILDRRFAEYNEHGVLFSVPAPLPSFFVSHDGAPLQFDANGNLRPYDPGTYYQPAFSSGGDGYRYAGLSALHSSVERLNANLLGHLDLENGMRLSSEVLFSGTERIDPQGTQIYNATLLEGADAAIPFTLDNPFLTDQARKTLQEASYFIPGQGDLPYVGQPIYLSKAWEDLVHSREIRDRTDTFRALVSLEGDWYSGGRYFYWTLSGSHAETRGSHRAWGLDQERFENAISAVRNSDGQIVCADRSAAGCAPINPFGNGNVSEAAREYISTRFRHDYDNRQQNFLATLGGTLWELPAGEIPFSVGYEYRVEKAAFSPNDAAAAGVGRDQPVLGIAGRYHTHEVSGELDIPLLEGLRFAREVDLNTAVRLVDNSLAGNEFVWNAGLNWQFNDQLKFRATRGRSFRTPSLTELFLPERSQSMAASHDPCDQRNIDAGLSPDVRRANCQAMFDERGMDGRGFVSNAQNVSIRGVLSGNSELESEVAHSLSAGFVWQPSFADGLSFMVDHIDIRIDNAIETFTLQDSLQVCYDSSEQPADICSLFVRDDEGQIVDARSSFINAGYKRYKAQNIGVHYDSPLAAGHLSIALDTTHVALNEQSVTGMDLTRIDDTARLPAWRSNLNMSYRLDSLEFGYFIDFLPRTRVSRTDSPETTPHYRIASNTVHGLSVRYDLSNLLSLRAGVHNLFDRQPSYPTVYYGDILGRRFHAGINLRF